MNNWKHTIEAIQHHAGMTQTQIGMYCGTRQSTISSLVIRLGSQPSHPLGQKLMELYKKSVPVKHRKKSAA